MEGGGFSQFVPTPELWMMRNGDILSDADNLKNNYDDEYDDGNSEGKKHNIDNHHEDHKDKDDKGKHHNDKPTMTKMYQCYYPKTLRDSCLFCMQIS